jgi:predicted ferric reductase
MAGKAPHQPSTHRLTSIAAILFLEYHQLLPLLHRFLRRSFVPFKRARQFNN